MRPRCVRSTANIWTTAIGAGFVVAAIGGLFERLVLTRLKANPLGQVLVTLGMSFIISDACLVIWGGDSDPGADAAEFASPDAAVRLCLSDLSAGAGRPGRPRRCRTVFLIERTGLGAMIRAGVDDRQMARAVGIPVSRLFTIVFCLGTGIAGVAGVLGGPFCPPIPGSTPTCCRWH